MNGIHYIYGKQIEIYSDHGHWFAVCPDELDCSVTGDSHESHAEYSGTYGSFPQRQYTVLEMISAIADTIIDERTVTDEEVWAEMRRREIRTDYDDPTYWGVGDAFNEIKAELEEERR